MDVGGPRRRDHFLQRRLGPCQPDVLRDRIDEQERLLQHDRAAVHEIGVPNVSQVHAVAQDPAAGRVVQPQQQRDQGRLAGSGGADDADRLALVERDGDAVEDPIPIVVCKRHILQLDCAWRSGQRAGVGRVAQVGKRLQNRVDPIQVRDHAPNRRVHRDQVQRRCVHRRRGARRLEQLR